MSLSAISRLLTHHRVVLIFSCVTCGLLALGPAEAQSQPPAVDAGRPDLADTAQALPHGGSMRLAGLFLAEFGVVQVEAERFRVFAEDAQVWRGATPGAVPRNVYLRGSVKGFPGSLAILSFRERGTIGGWILVDGTWWQIRGRAGVGGLASEKLDPELAGDPFDCLADALPGSLGAAADSLQITSETPEAAPVGTFSYTAGVAVDTDWEFLALFGGDETAAIDYVGDLFAFASAIYEAEIDTSLYVNFLRLWPGTANGDPWTAGDCTNQLYEFRDYWRTNEAGQTRAIAHLLSGKNTGCGIAWVGALCSSSYGYGVSASIKGTFDPADPLPPVWDIIVVSHEIGHNFNSPHTHCYNGIPDASWADPVDPCYTESGCYTGPTSLPDGCPGSGQGCGTIMSYCHLRSGSYGNIALTFGGSVRDGSSHAYGVFPERVPERMHDYVLSRAGSGCLDPVTGHTLTITRSGEGTGAVTSDDGGIDCGSDCTETYAAGVSPTVTLTATPAPGSTFAGWSGDADCSDGSVTMNAARSCTATFDTDTPSTYTLTIEKSGGGSGTVSSHPAGIDCGSDCTEDYEPDLTVSLAATPATGSIFIGWSGDADCIDGSLTMNADRTCTATFETAKDLIVTLAGAGSGAVTSTPAGITCGTDCQESFTQGITVQLSASADPGSVFAGWSGDIDCGDGTVRMNKHQACTATFDLVPPPSYLLTVSTGGTGSGSVTSSPSGIDCGSDCSETYDEGTVVALSAAAGAGSSFSGWSGDADCGDGAVSVEGPRTCIATFDLLPPPAHTLAVSLTGNGSGSVTSAPVGIDCGTECSADFVEGAAVTLIPAADPGSAFVGWTGDADCADGAVTMADDRQCEARFDVLSRDIFADGFEAGSTASWSESSAN